MFFLIRLAFWFSLVLLILPLDTGKNADAAPSVGPLQAFVTVREAIGDVAGLCERKPDVCETGKAALHTIGARAQEVARIASDLIESQAGGSDTSISTGSISSAGGSATAKSAD